MSCCCCNQQDPNKIRKKDIIAKLANLPAVVDSDCISADELAKFKVRSFDARSCFISIASLCTRPHWVYVPIQSQGSNSPFTHASYISSLPQDPEKNGHSLFTKANFIWLCERYPFLRNGIEELKAIHFSRTLPPPTFSDIIKEAENEMEVAVNLQVSCRLQFAGCSLPPIKCYLLVCRAPHSHYAASLTWLLWAGQYSPKTR